MLKWIGIALAAVLGLVLAGALTLYLTFDPNDYRDFAGRWVSERTGRTLAIEGDLELSFFPWLGVSADQLTLSNAAGFAPEHFASAENAVLRVKLLPLLQRRFEVDTVELTGMLLNLGRDEQGRGNWQDLLGNGPAPAGTPGDGNAAAVNVEIAGLKLDETTVYWREAGEVRYIARQISLSTSELQPGRPVELDLAMNLLSFLR